MIGMLHTWLNNNRGGEIERRVDFKTTQLNHTAIGINNVKVKGITSLRPVQ